MYTCSPSAVVRQWAEHVRARTSKYSMNVCLLETASRDTAIVFLATCCQASFTEKTSCNQPNPGSPLVLVCHPISTHVRIASKHEVNTSRVMIVAGQNYLMC